MLYTFYVKLTSFDDDQLSYKLFKHPDNVYERDHSNVKIVGKFTRTNGIVDDKSYEILMYQETDEILYNKISWNFVELSALSLRELNIVFNNVLRAAVRSKHEENLSVEQMTSSNHYKLELLPVDPGAFTNIEKMGKYVEIAKQLGIELTYDKNKLKVTLETESMVLYSFLQKSYLLIFSMLAKYSTLSKMELEKVEQFVNMSNEWIGSISEPLKTYFVKNLMKYRETLIAKFGSISETEIIVDESLHEKKHKLIIELLKNMEQSPYEHIVEFGCSTGQFAKELVNSTKSTDIKSNLDNVTTAENEFNYLGFDIDYIAIQKAKRKLSKYKNVKLKQADIVNSYIPEVTCSNVLLLIEFIEHLTTEERNTLAKLLNEAYQPYNIVITTPNIEYNINYGLAEGQYRHRDHLIEFNNDELNEYLALFTNYTWTLHNIPSYDDIQPSFVVCMQLKDTAKINDDFVNEFRAKQIEHAYEKGAMQSPFMLPNFSYTVNSKQIKIGMESKAFKANRDKVFYLGSSMAPSDIKQMYGAFETLQNEGIFAMPGIEHPMYAIDYFNSKGISTNDLVAEIKYMGSRAYILAFKNEQIAKMFNMPLITINSRSGWEFFDEEDDNFKHEIYNVIRDSFLSDNDFIALDAEITPWLYKSKGLIYKEFALPVLLQLNGAIAAFNETFSTTDNSRFLNAIVLCTDFLSTLEHFSKVEPIHVHVFDMLAKGTIGKYDRPVVQYGRHLDRLTVNEWLNERLISNDIVSIAKQVKGADIMSLWTSLDDSYEGIVIKPRKYEFKNGSAIIPYMKCRRDSYLQLIYSPYFNEESLQRRIFYRNVAKKRRLSLFQDELGFYILNAFFKQETQLLHKYIATFYATDGVGDFGGQDMTL